MEKSMKIFITVCTIIGLSSFAYIVKEDSDWIQQYKTGDKSLYCYINGKGYIEIDPKKIVSFDENSGTWIFINGHAKTCNY